MADKYEALRDRTKQAALRVMRLASRLPRGRSEDVIARQLVKSGTSVGANYRSACRAKSTRDFIAKMGIVEEEADESGYWMELIADSGLMQRELIADLLQESNELVAIAVASIRTARDSEHG